MAKAAEASPISQTVAPGDQAELAERVRAAHDDGTAIYPIGGGTSLDFGLPAKVPGVGLSLAGLGRVIDYPARDMTITVEAGITMQALAETLAREKQRLPVDVPHADRATLGGVIATNWNGPRRFGEGTMRDHVIGIAAVDGRGMPFKGGGRVVKNVAGYDFCKLLCGSLGTLGVITQVTLKLKPLPERSGFVACRLDDVDQAERVLAALVHSQATPNAVELLVGPAAAAAPGLASLAPQTPPFAPVLALGLEGTAVEVAWMQQQLRSELAAAGCVDVLTVEDQAVPALWRWLADFSQSAPSPLAIKATLRPGALTRFVAAAQDLDPQADLQCHAGTGIVLVRFSEFPPGGISQAIVGRLAPLAAQAGGHVVLLSNPGGAEMTRLAVWGGNGPFDLMAEIKRRFDPRGILNPGRFVYPDS